MRIKRWMSWTTVAALLVAGVVAGGAQPGQAVVPDRFAFALYFGGVVSEQTPAATTVVPGVPGRYTVTFPAQGIAGGVVHVVAVHNALASPPGRWCQADGWGQVAFDEVVKVSCYRPGGFLDPVPGFSVMFARSSGVVGGGLYGYVHSTAAGAIVTQYNSVGGANLVVHPGAGSYSVSLLGLGTPGPQDGGLQVTAVNPAAGARCKVGGWSSTPNGQFVRVLCFNSAGALTDNAFTITYQHKRSLYGPAFAPFRFGYLWNVPPLGAPTTNFNSSGVLNALAAGPPVWTVTMPNIAASPGNTQVTAYGVTSDFCGLHAPWGPAGAALVARVNCFTNVGAPVNSGFFASYSSLF